jgi:hypothetical protein
MANGNIPRRHHFVSQFLLAGFTADGSKDSRLYVSDLQAEKGWQAKTTQAAHERDLYELDIQGISGLDPMAAEKGLASIESQTSSILTALLNAPGTMLSQSDLRQLLYFIALQVGRVPSEQPRIEEAYQRLVEAMATPETWEVERKGRNLVTPEYSYEELNGQLGTQSVHTLFVLTMIASAEILLPVLSRRRWGLLVSPGISFICSDRPVTTITRSNSPERTEPGRIADDDLDIIVPLHARLCLFGTEPAGSIPEVDNTLVSKLNSCLARGADRFLYSKELDFVWRRMDDSDGKGLQEFLNEPWPSATQTP